MKKINIKILIIILIISALLRLYHLAYPNDFVFDEVYYAFTAQEYLKGNPDAWVWWASVPEGRAIAWVNPPLPQEIMALFMFVFNTDNSLAWRLPSVIMGVLSIYAVFLICKILFQNETTALIAAFIFSLDGLNFAQSRIGMLDIYLVTFMLASLYFILKNQYFTSSIFFGLALASKWTAIYILLIFILIIIKNHQFLKIIYLIIIPSLIYLLVYLPFFLTGHDFNQFIGLIKQEIWYHTNLKATHDYASFWWSWPFNLYPVWYYVLYFGDKISNIFASGNQVLFIMGSVAICKTVWDYLRDKSVTLGLILLGYFIFLLPWAFSPRVMFLYYYTPSVPFMCMALAYQLNNLLIQKKYYLFWIFILLIVIGFFLTYPFLVGIPLSKELVRLFFLTNLAKNPF